MKYKLIASDLDGTLLNDNSEITGRTKAAIRAAIAKGALFVPATGRPLCGVERVNILLEGDMPFVLFNGAKVMTGKTKRLLFEQNLDSACALGIWQLGLERDIPIIIWVDETLYINRDCDEVREYRKITGATIHLTDDISGLQGITKMLWLCDPAQALRWQDELNARFAGRVNCHTSWPQMLEFVDAKASKGLALAAIGAAYGIDRSEMIAFGDNYNDVSMLEYAGLGIAMANAPEDIKAKCQEVTLSNNEDGVAVAMERYVLGGDWLRASDR